MTKEAKELIRVYENILIEIPQYRTGYVAILCCINDLNNTIKALGNVNLKLSYAGNSDASTFLQNEIDKYLKLKEEIQNEHP